MKKIFLIVLDSFGCGELPDARDFGDVGGDTLGTLVKNGLTAPNLAKLGLFNIDGVAGTPIDNPIGQYFKCRELSAGKDTTLGHLEISGLVSHEPLRTFPNGFPAEFMAEFERKVGCGTICNKPYSGTDVLVDYGQEHIETGKLIVYTSADSVFQVAAHEKYFGLDRLYEVCHIAREMLVGDMGVDRVIARPFIGENPDFVRTSNRHDYSFPPPGETMLNRLKDSGKNVIGVGKIYDIFAGSGVTLTVRTVNNDDGMSKLDFFVKCDFNGLCFANLVDTDMLFGHRRNILGYKNAIEEFDAWLGDFLSKLDDDAMLIITADHGCDPGFPGTDHTREHIPVVIWQRGIETKNLGIKPSFTAIAEIIEDYLR